MMNEKKRLSSKTWVKRLLSFVLVLAMMVTMIPSSGLSVAKAEETITVYFRNDWLWTDINVHYWGSSAGDTSWPGKAMTYIEKGTDGKDIYSCEIPGDVTGIIFNGIKNDGSGSRDQSPNIESGIADGNAYYMHWDNGNKCSTFTYTPPVEDDGKVTVHYYNINNWSDVAGYVWESTDSNNSWPGVVLTENAEHTGWYDLEVTDTDGYFYCIFNNNGAGNQTANIAVDHSDGTDEFWYIDNSLAKTAPDAWTNDTAPETYEVVIHYSNASNWSSVYGYVWESTGSNNIWPGEVLAENADNTGWYDLYVTDTDGVFNCIFNNGSGSQTADLAVSHSAENKEFWYVDGAMVSGAPEGWDDGEDDGKVTVHYYNINNWSSVAGYVWESTGSNNDWPGEVLAENAEHAGWYDLEVTDTDGYFNCIFNNNGGGNQTADIGVDHADGTDEFWYIDNSLVKVAPDAWTGAVVPETYEVVVHYFNASNWSSVYGYVWESTGSNNSWPGGVLEENADNADWYDLIVVDADGAFNCIFNNGSGSQTADLAVSHSKENKEFWYVDGAMVSEAPSDWDEGEPPVEPAETYEAIFHFADTLGWGTVNLYTWYGAGTQLTGSWPGTKVSQDADGFYTMAVTFEDPNGTGLNFIFNNGGAQTVDLNLPHSAFDENRKAEKWIVLTDTTEGKYNADILDSGDTIAISPQVDGTTVTFEYKNASAASVEVRGSFNEWKAGEYVMTKDAYGIWSVTIENMAPGLHEYKFVVDGNWITDPCNSQTQNGNSTFLILDPNAVDNNEIIIHVYYDRADGLYTVEDADGVGVDGVWNAYVWGDSMGGTRYDFEKNSEGKMVTTIKVVGRDTQYVNLKTRLSTDTKDWLKEESQVSISLTDIVSGTIDVYITSAGNGGNAGDLSVSQIQNVDIVKGNKITDLQYDYETGKITVTTLNPLIDAANELAIVNINDNNDNVAIESVQTQSGSYVLTVNKKLSLSELYNYKIKFDGYYYDIDIDSVYASDKFAEEYTYDGDDLGAEYTDTKTTFRVWAPTAEEVAVRLYTTGSDGETGAADLGKYAMTRGEKGVWSVEIQGDLRNIYYTYEVAVNGETIETGDPYAYAAGVNGERSMVIDLDKTDPAGWDQDTNPNPLTSYTDAVIYELHVRDFSMDESSGISEANRGKFLAFTEEGTTVNGAGQISSGVDYLEDLGITHLHLLPIYDYASVKEDKLDTPQFNWGYDPLNYNVPEGSYSRNPYDGTVRVNEMKQMVMALHDNGISVIMDVVYNHVYNSDTFCFNQIVPGYFSRVDSNASGCGNDTASEREMVRKYIVESVLYWTEEYHIDGFRFDLVGLLDVETINEIVTEVHKIRPDVIFYGEGWDMDGTNKEPGTEMAKQGNSSKTPGFAYFSDNIRNLLGGNNGHSIGFASGQSGVEGDVVNNFMAKPWWTSNPAQVVQYASCHDNYTLMDKIILSTQASGINADVIKMNNLAAAVYMTAQGIPFIHAGEEFLREKLDENGKRVENSYNASDFVNHIEWSNLEKETYAANSAYYQGLIAFRKAHPALSLATSEEIASVVYNQQASGNVVSFWLDGREVEGETHDSIYVIFNANRSARNIELPEGDWDICINGTQAGTDVIDTVSGNVSVAGISAMVLVQEESTEEPVGPAPKSDVALPGSFNNWNTGNFMEIGEEENTVVTTLSLPAGDYTFKVKIGDTWYGNNGTIEDETGEDGWLMDASAGDCKLQASGGAYTFIYNTVTKKLVVVYDAEGGEFGNPGDYYLCGWINGMDYAMGIEPGEYKFENGKLIAKFDQDSYVLVKNGDNTKTYWTDGYLGAVTSATLYDQTKHTLTQDKWDKMLIPGGVEVEFTLTINDNDTVTLSYVSTASLGVKDTSGVQDGVTLHCWNWSFEEIEKNMATIAAQGFTAIQTSPIQPLKEATNLDINSVGGNWWVYYQPIDFVITDQSGNALGTGEELKSMIETAHDYGIQVIVDVVANHLANETGNDLADEIPEEIRNNEDYWHDITTDITNWNDRYDMTQHCMSGLPDLNTANKDVQAMVLDFLKECVDLGVDGFRFDAAKSIETPSDEASFASDFWPVVVGGAENYAQETYGKDLYIYGEVLDVPAISVSAYTQYMAITDNSWGNNLRNDVVNGKANLSAGYHKAANADNLVLWAESHDTYMTGDEAQSSYGVSEEDIMKTWALVAARADAMGLYFARPESIEQALGIASATGWADEVVREVNLFHNQFDGEEETIGNDAGVSYVLRGDEGVVLVRVEEASAGNEVTVKVPGMTDGSYMDQVTGKLFQVEDGVITGEIGDTDVAVVYQPESYKVIEGMNSSWQEDSDQDLRFRATGQFSLFKGIRIDGSHVDPKYYTAQAGSVIIILHAEYLDMLAVGEHTLEVLYESQNTIYTAETTFHVLRGSNTNQPSQPQTPDSGTNAPTGDEAPVLFCSVMALAALAVVAEAERRRRHA